MLIDGRRLSLTRVVLNRDVSLCDQGVMQLLRSPSLLTCLVTLVAAVARASDGSPPDCPAGGAACRPSASEGWQRDASPSTADAHPLRESFEQRLDRLGSGHAALGESLDILREVLGDAAGREEARRPAIEAWLRFVDRHAPAWCRNEAAFRAPWFAERVSFDGAAPWASWVVDANDPRRTLVLDRGECGYVYVLREPGQEETYFQPEAPELLVGNGGDCDGSALPTDLGAEWRDWHARWDAFEAATRPVSWVRLYEFGPRAADRSPGTRANGSDHADPYGLRLTASPPDQLTIWFQNRVLAEVLVDLTETPLCPHPDPGDGSDGHAEDDCAWVETWSYAYGTLILELGLPDPFSDDTRVRVIPLDVQDAPSPVVYCGKGSTPIVRWPEWLAAEAAHLPDAFAGKRTRVVASVPRLIPADAVTGDPDLGAVESAFATHPNLAREASSEIRMVRKLIKSGFPRRLDQALSALRGPLSKRYEHLQGWRDLLAAMPGYLEDLLESGRAEKAHEADAKRAAAAQARKQRDADRATSKLLAAVPSAGSRCKAAIKKWHAQNEAIERAAVTGRPAAVAAARKRRDAAGRTVCDLSQRLREAVAIYQQRGLHGAADAISREYHGCLASCR